MPLRQQKFTIIQDNLQDIIDVDASDGRSVPVNMNFVDEGYLTKDTGIALFGNAQASLLHSLFYFKKKNGNSFIVAGTGKSLKYYSSGTGLWTDIAAGTVTITVASPAVATLVAHGFKAGTPITFSTTGALPTGVTAGTTYYVIATGLTSDAFQFSATVGGAAINTSGTQSGVHTVTRVYTEGAEFGFTVYNDELYGGNGVENFFKWTGTALTEYDTAPKGNITEVFEDRFFIAGVTAEPLTAYYSNVGNPTTFTPTDLVKPLGTDSITNLKNYYGTMLIFKQDSIWKLTFNYDQVVSLFVPKLEQQSGTYGACSRKAVSWVENDLWFFTGREVRAIGFSDNVSGIFGINQSVISEPIKETLKRVSIENFKKVIVFYENRRFYLGVPLETGTVDTVFVCHTLYKNSWTKYTGRDKARVNDFMVVDGNVYSTKAVAPFGAIRWTASLNDIATPISSQVFFRRLQDKQFNRFRIFRYLDILFKDLVGTIELTIRQEASDLAEEKNKSFFLGNSSFGALIGEVMFGDGLFAGGVAGSIEYSPFIKKRVSFLSKNQAIVLGLGNSELDETFTIAQFAFMGMEQPEKLFSSSKIISVV